MIFRSSYAVVKHNLIYLNDNPGSNIDHIENTVDRR